MNTSKLFRIGLTLTLIFQVLLSALIPGGTAAAANELNPPTSDPPVVPFNRTPFDPELQLDDFPLASAVESQEAAPLADTTLEVSILSSPWATVDSNPDETKEEPDAFVVHAVVTNTGTVAANKVSLTLDYQEDSVNNWVLLPGESPVRTIEQLAVGETYYGYWLASYPVGFNLSHQYTVSANADNADQVSTSENFYLPDPNKTLTTRSTISTGSSGITQVSADTVVGVLFEIIVNYDLGSNPQEVSFSPVGNPNFDASALRLMETRVRFYDSIPTTPDISVDDRLYFETLDPSLNQAEVTYTFLPQKPTTTLFCPYAAVKYASTEKYDKDFCNEKHVGSIIPITGTLSIAMEKKASAIEIQQGQVVTYTINYTNTGTFPITYAWIWDEVEPSMASIRLDSVSPTPTSLDSNLVGWYLGDIPASGFSGSTGTLTFSVNVDGNGHPLADNTLLVNHAFYGVNQGSLPEEHALTSTFTTTVQAPTITISKTDGLPTAEPGDLINYTLNITNTGAITATGLVITDILPDEVTQNGSPSPAPDGGSGQTLVWTTLEPLAPAGGTASITVPVILGEQVENGTVLTNTMTAQYYNTAGYLYETDPTFDTTLVNAPVLSISKSDYPDPVLTGRLITYTLSYANDGPGLATHVVITDILPDNTAFDSCTGGCSQNGGLISWELGELSAGENGDVTFTVRVDDGLDNGTIISNQDYGITSDQTGTNSGPLVTTTVYKDAAIFEGYTFEDANGNGLYDMASETAISGVVLTMTNATVPHTTSDGDGYYRFRVESGDNDLLSASLPSGMFRTTPGSVYIDVTLGITRTVNFGYANSTSSFGVVYGTVFQDDNHDGGQDLGEDGLSDVALHSAQAVNPNVTTNALGQYTLRFDSPVTATITETNPDDYVSTTPDVVQTEVVTGSINSFPVDFGDFLGIKIAGQVFDDINVNGVKDAGEAGLAGAQLSANTDSFTTGSNGEYILYEPVLDSTAVLISETDPDDYLSTNAVPGEGMSRVDANTLRLDVPISGNVYAGGDFGDVLATSVITVSGYVWDDNGANDGTAGDGVWDTYEPPITGVMIQLSSGLSETTALDGAFQLIGPAETITVTETNPVGYISSNAIPGTGAIKWDNDTLVISGLAGGDTSSDNLFGDVQTADLSITKQATPQSVVAGDTITYTLRFTNTGIWPAYSVNITDTLPSELQFGEILSMDAPFTFSGLHQGKLAWKADSLSPGASGSIVFTAAVKPGAIGSIMNRVVIDSSTQDVDQENNFARVDTTIGIPPGSALLYGYVFEDLDGDSIWDGTEAALPDVLITLDESITATTNTQGRYYFLTDQVGVHSILEEDPSSYFSTTPNEVHVDVLLDESYRVDFGDATDTADFANIYGTVFNDLDSDGIWDADETGIPGVSVSLDQAYTITTGLYGSFSLSSKVSGTHQIVETDLAGFISTTPNQVSLSIDIGQSYQVDFGDLELCTCGPDSFEEDDTWQQAKPIQVGTAYSQTHDFCDDAIDWLSFNAQADQVYTISTTAWGQRADTNLALYDSDGETMLVANDDFEDQEDFSSRIVWQPSVDGVYFIRVDNRAALNCCDTEYDIWIEIPQVTTFTNFLPIITNNWVEPENGDADINSAAGVISHVCPDDYEFDDTWSDAYAIQAGVLQTHSFDSNPAVFAADKDLVSFNISGDETVVFSIETLTNTQTLLELYDAQGLALDVTGSTTLSWTATNPGKYFLSVSPIDQGDFGCSDVAGYDLLMEIQRQQQYGVMLPLLMR